MRKANKIIWQDGMFMHPQHLQQQDLYYENLLCSHQIMQPYHNWGLFDFEIDEGFLNINKIVIRKAKGVFPNGTVFDIPNRDEIPEPIEIPNNYENKIIYLGITLYQKFSPNKSGTRKAQLSRYYGTEEELEDLTSDQGQKQNIMIGNLNINLFLEDEYVDHIIRVPLLRIRNANPGVKLDYDYIPPCLKLFSSKLLVSYTNRVFGLLTTYLNTHYTSRLASSNTAFMIQSENLLILQTVSNFKSLFELLIKDNATTPYHLFEKLVSVTASLSVFIKDIYKKPLEVFYDHLNIANSFNPIIARIEEIFNELRGYTPTEVELNNRGDMVYIGLLNDTILTIINTAELILGLELPENNNIEVQKLASGIKVSPASDIDDIINLKISGINFITLNIIPPYIPYKESTIYIKIEKKDNLWNKVIQQGEIAVYPGNNLNKIASVKLWIIP